MRFLKRNTRSRRKANRTGLNIVFRHPRAPRHAVGSGPLLALPPASSMEQRTVKLPLLPPATAYQAPRSASDLQDMARLAAFDAAERVTRSATGRPAYEIRTDVPLFRNEAALTEYEERYQARVRRIQRLAKPWPDGHGVALGSDQSTHTLVISTADYREFAGGQVSKQVSR